MENIAPSYFCGLVQPYACSRNLGTNELSCSHVPFTDSQFMLLAIIVYLNQEY
jgi:hypothetical protein